MRVAALYDIHGNLPALEAVLAEIDNLGVDTIMVGGDVTMGPLPNEVMDLLSNRRQEVRFVHGNCELAIFDRLEGRSPRDIHPSVFPIIEWVGARLSETYLNDMRSWPITDRISIDGLGDVLFCHAKPADEHECFTRLTDESALLGDYDGIGADVVVCGHTHMQVDRMVGKVRVVNAGSIGMPFANPGAYWLLLSEKGINFRCTAYDLHAAADRIRATDYPKAQDFADMSILNPPAAPEMEARFKDYTPLT